MDIARDLASLRAPPQRVVALPTGHGRSLSLHERSHEMADELAPKDAAEEVALFRSQVLGPLLCRGALDHGQLAEALREISAQPVRPPGASRTRTYAVSTLQRWLYAYRAGGLAGLQPQPRSDRGHARALTDAQRALLVEIRQAYPRVSASLILRTLVADGRIDAGTLTESTVRRFLSERGLDRTSAEQHGRQPRRRWETAAPNALWHADVCHGPALRTDGGSVPLRIHAILDDHSRHVVALRACTTERETEMLSLMVGAMRQHGAPDALYLDNGPTYVGETLSTACGRLGIGLIHAKPHDPQARGKMERFWRTLRQQCLDHLGTLGSLHDVQVRLLAWLDGHYLVTPHGSLMGKTPAQVYQAAQRQPVSESMLREALIVRARRRLRGDGTLSVGGVDFELDASYLCGRLVTVGRCLLDPSEPPWVEHEQQRLPLRPVDARDNAKHPRRTKRPKTGLDAVDFDPTGARLRAHVGGGQR
jgi:transposase InsO family protein